MTPPVCIEPGTRADADALAAFHYRGGPPATCVRVLRAMLVPPGADAPMLAGVLLVSMPTLNAAWRAKAWPDLFRAGTPRALQARTLNRRVRTLSRVIVDPRVRGLGVASTLVRAYLARPLTERTEAISAMSRVSPLFASAGMREVRVPAPERDRLLRRELRVRGLSPHALLADRRSAGSVARALREWARWSRGTRRLADGPLAELALAAGSRLLAPPLVFVAP